MYVRRCFRRRRGNSKYRVGRLAQETDGTNTMAYQYDDYGNRKQLSVSGAENYTTSYDYDKNNLLKQETKTLGSNIEVTKYEYDPNGNTISALVEKTEPSTGTVDPEEYTAGLMGHAQQDGSLTINRGEKIHEKRRNKCFKCRSTYHSDNSCCWRNIVFCDRY